MSTTDKPPLNERGLREEVFLALIDHWSTCDDRQRRTWLAWLTGQLSIESLNSLKIRLAHKRSNRG